MTEIIFVVVESDDGGYTAQSPGAAIVTEADTVPELHAMVRDVVHCYFEEDDLDRPKLIRLHFVRDEVIAA